MPTQTIGADTPEWAVGDTAPPLDSLLTDGAGDAIDLTACTVVINIAWASYSYYYAPQNRLVNAGACVPFADQVADKGWVRWTPGATDLEVAGDFRYTYEITFPDSSRQTIAPNANNTMFVRAPVGGMQFA